MRYKINSETTMITKLKNENFNPEGECRFLALNSIIRFFNIFNVGTDDIYKLTSFKKITTFFESKGYTVKGYIAPQLKRFTLKYNKYSNNYIDFFQKTNKYEKTAFLCLISAKDLYNIDELWNHFISIFTYNTNKKLIYDSYFDIAKLEYQSVDLFRYLDLCKKEIICLKITANKS